ncbi:MAG: 30S ribosomal protein S8 [Nitrospirae bacterium]|nr:30S ribosomal protein S8 [Nitrospirota bacterium]
MVMTDPIADMLTRIRNANMQKHSSVEIPLSNMKVEMARILKESGFVTDYKVTGEGVEKSICLYLKYSNDDIPTITGIKRVSTPGRRVYVNKESIPKVMGGIGISIISTSKGLLTDREAKRANVGGELLCHLW